MESTSTAPQVLLTSGVCARDHVLAADGAWIPTGVVTADLWATIHGTGMSFAGRPPVVGATRVPTPRQYKSSVTGITTLGPPV
jgi:hypothetical protein